MAPSLNFWVHARQQIFLLRQMKMTLFPKNHGPYDTPLVCKGGRKSPYQHLGGLEQHWFRAIAIHLKDRLRSEVRHVGCQLLPQWVWLPWLQSLWLSQQITLVSLTSTRWLTLWTIAPHAYGPISIEDYLADEGASIDSQFWKTLVEECRFARCPVPFHVGI